MSCTRCPSSLKERQNHGRMMTKNSVKKKNLCANFVNVCVVKKSKQISIWKSTPRNFCCLGVVHRIAKQYNMATSPLPQLNDGSSAAVTTVAESLQSHPTTNDMVKHIHFKIILAPNHN